MPTYWPPLIILVQFIPWNSYLVVDRIILRSMPHKIDAVSMLMANLYSFRPHLSTIPLYFIPWNSNLLAVYPVISRSNSTKIQHDFCVDYIAHSLLMDILVCVDHPMRFIPCNWYLVGYPIILSAVPHKIEKVSIVYIYLIHIYVSFQHPVGIYALKRKPACSGFRHLKLQ